MFSTKNITRMSVFTVLSYLLYMPVFEFSLLPAVPFLKVDFSNTFVMMTGFAMGPVPAIIVGVLKEILHALTWSQTVGVGELANIIIMLPYVLIPSLVYMRHRNIKTVMITLPIGCAAQAAWSVPVNYLLTFPFFMVTLGATWKFGMEFYLTIWYWAVLFNFVKTLLISGAVMLLYKQFQRLFSVIFGEGRARTARPIENNKHVIDSAEQMEELGKSVAQKLSGGAVILLSGELGAGKTVFCRGVARALGVTSPVVSPTFTIMNEYEGSLKFCHFDAYRLSGADEATEAGLTDYIGVPDCLCAVEWWENISPLFDGLSTVRVSIQKIGEGQREVTVTE